MDVSSTVEGEDKKAGATHMNERWGRDGIRRDEIQQGSRRRLTSRGGGGGESKGEDGRGWVHSRGMRSNKEENV